MKTLGFLGGMTWESTLEYYRRLNQRVKERYGGLHSARCLIYSFDFQELADLQNAGRWEELGDLLAERVRRELRIPLVHIVEETAKRILGLLGTRITMEDGFFAAVLESRGIRTLLPPASDREEIQRLIFAELALGRLESSSRETCLRIAGELGARGAQAVVLGCTELPLLLADAPAPVPWLDTLDIHVRAAVELV